MEQKAHIIVVEDDRFLRDLLQAYLESQGFAVTATGNGEAMRAALRVSEPDLAVMDVRLPGEDGFSLTRFLRDQKPDMGVVILTTQTDTIDRVVGLEVGADDYITKPFEERELLARIRSVLRRRTRTSNLAIAPKTLTAENLTIPPWRFDPSTRSLHGTGGKQVPLTASETGLLVELIKNANTVVDRSSLSIAVLGRAWRPEDRSIDVLVGRLRSKLGEDGRRSEVIRSVRGVGYVLRTKNPAGEHRRGQRRND